MRHPALQRVTLPACTAVLVAVTLVPAAIAQAPASPPDPPPPAEPGRWPMSVDLEPPPPDQSDPLFRGAEEELLPGVDLHVTLTLDYSVGLDGGVDSNGTAFRNLFDLNVAFDLERLIGLPGASAYINFQNQDGESGSAEITGDLQEFDNIDAESFTQISELWYEQWLANRHVRLKLGKVDASTEFASSEHGSAFLHNGMNTVLTIFVFPWYPDPATGINVFVYPNESLYGGIALYDGALQEGYSTGRLGPSTFFGEPADLFWIAEAGLRWGHAADRLPGRFAVGGWLHTGNFEHFDGSTTKDTGGGYAMLDQALWRVDPSDPDDERGGGMFLLYGHADEDVSDFVHHVSGGLAVTGPLPGRDEDIVGVAASYADLTSADGAPFNEDYELGIETFYRLQVTPFVAMQPVLQYIVNPGGDSSIDDALVFTLRVEIGF